MRAPLRLLTNDDEPELEHVNILDDDRLLVHDRRSGEWYEITSIVTLPISGDVKYIVTKVPHP